MPVGCLEKECRECEWMVVKGGVLDCNHKNRLGLAKPVLGSFTSKETDREVIERKLKKKKKEVEEMTKILKEEGEKSADVPEV